MPLNPTLHRRIEALARRKPRLGPVKISSPDQPGAARVVSRPGGKLDLQIDDWGESYRVNCPFCLDGRSRLYINYRYGQPNPSCDGRYPLKHVFKCYNSECQSSANNRERLWTWLYGPGNTSRPRGHVVLEGRATVAPLHPVPAPGDLIALANLPDTDRAVGYLLLRRFDRETFRRFDLSYCVRSSPDERLSVEGRIIIPIDFNGVRCGWQARLPNEPRERREPKYLTSTGLPKGRILYNYDRARQMPFLILVEGVTSVWRLGDNAVAAFGKEVSEHQTRVLAEASRGEKPVIVLLDGGEDKAIRSALHMLQRHRVPALRVDLPPGLDPADFNREQLFGLIYTQARAQGVLLPGAAP